MFLRSLALIPTLLVTAVPLSSQQKAVPVAPTAPPIAEAKLLANESAYWSAVAERESAEQEIEAFNTGPLVIGPGAGGRNASMARPYLAIVERCPYDGATLDAARVTRLADDTAIMTYTVHIPRGCAPRLSGPSVLNVTSVWAVRHGRWKRVGEPSIEGSPTRQEARKIGAR